MAARTLFPKRSTNEAVEVAGEPDRSNPSSRAGARARPRVPAVRVVVESGQETLPPGSLKGPPPRAPSRRRSLKVPIPVPAMLAWLAFRPRRRWRPRRSSSPRRRGRSSFRPRRRATVRASRACAGHHVPLHVVADEVEAEAVHLVLLRPGTTESIRSFSIIRARRPCSGSKSVATSPSASRRW